MSEAFCGTRWMGKGLAWHWMTWYVYMYKLVLL
jgi:hypothetical protein